MKASKKKLKKNEKETNEEIHSTKDYKIRLNEKLTVAKINKILDAIDNNNGYCPC